MIIFHKNSFLILLNPFKPISFAFFSFPRRKSIESANSFSFKGVSGARVVFSPAKQWAAGYVHKLQEILAQDKIAKGKLGFL